MDLKEIIPIIERRKFFLKEENFRKSIYSNDDIDIILERCMCSVIADKKNKINTCKENNDLFITPDGKISLCRNSNAEIEVVIENGMTSRDIGALLEKRGVIKSKDFSEENCDEILQEACA